MDSVCGKENCCWNPSQCAADGSLNEGPTSKSEFDIIAAMSKVRDVILSYGQACVKAGKEMASSLDGIDDGATESEKLALEHFTASMFEQVMNDIQKDIQS